MTSRHTHVKYADHPVTAGLPDLLDLPDAGMVYMDPVPEEGWWTPEEGEMTVLYACDTVPRAGEVPSIVLYERGSGRSVTFGGLRHTDGSGRYERDPVWYNHSMSLPEVRQLLASAMTYVLEPFARKESLDECMEESRTYLENRLDSLRMEIETAAKALDRQRNDAVVQTVLVVGASAAAILVLGYFGLIRQT
jgi:hypothetical protein